MTKYYYAGASRIAMRQDGDLFFVLGDHLGSTSLVTDDEGTVISETKYKAWGEIRYSSGTNPTDYTFTGQFSYTDDFGLVFYNARWYDPSLGRFAQADTIVPNGVQGLDRYAYVNNSPVNYIDPTGHDAWWCNTTSCQSNYNNSMANTGGGSFNISNNGGSGGGVVGGGGIGNSSNNCGFCDLVNSANDIMQELFGGHQYTAPPSLVCLPLPWINCTPSETDTYLAGNQFPGQLPWQPVQSLGQYNVFPAQFNNIDIMDRVSSGSGSIQVLIKDNTITNITNDTHIFHVGYVNRTSHEGPFGMTYVTTYGAGYNDGFEVWGHSIPGWMIDQANNLVGPFAFTALNVQMVLYTTWVETEQALNGIQQP